MNLKLFSILILMLMINKYAYSQTFTDEQKFDIRDSTLILLKNYTEYSDMTDDGKSLNESYIKKFLSLFTDEALIVDDLSGTGQMIKPAEYVNIVKNSFSGGIEIKAELDSAYFKNLKKVEDVDHQVIVDCRKYTVGLNDSRKLIRKDITATFTIHFKFDKGVLSDFKIAHIISREIILKRHSDKKMKGLYGGLNIDALAANIFTENNFQYYTRDYKMSGSYSIGITADYFLSSNYAIGAGIYYNSLNSNSNTIYNNGTDNNLQGVDIDNDSYFLYVNSDMIEENKLKFVSIPLKLTYRHKLYDKISLFASAGVSVSYMLSSSSLVLGSSLHSAWYDEYNLLVDEAPFYNLGELNYNDSFELPMTELFFSGMMNVGVSIPLKEGSYLNIGLKLNHSFTDLGYEQSSYRDDYINLHGVPKYLFLQSGGLSVSYQHKF